SFQYRSMNAANRRFEGNVTSVSVPLAQQYGGRIQARKAGPGDSSPGGEAWKTGAEAVVEPEAQTLANRRRARDDRGGHGVLPLHVGHDVFRPVPARRYVGRLAAVRPERRDYISGSGRRVDGTHRPAEAARRAEPAAAGAGRPSVRLGAAHQRPPAECPRRSVRALRRLTSHRNGVTAR